jgi:hypothetical protein
MASEDGYLLGDLFEEDEGALLGQGRIRADAANLSRPAGGFFEKKRAGLVDGCYLLAPPI